MEINIKNENLSVCSGVCRSKNNFTTECEVIVPDSKPDILKVLQLSARPKVSSCEARGGRVTISGTVCFNILYLADDEEKCVKSITSSCEFSHIIKDDHIDDSMPVFFDADVCDINCNIVNCRKLSLKSTICANIRVYSCYDIEVVTDIEGACTKKAPLSSEIICAHCQDNAYISDSFTLSPGKKAVTEILKSDANVIESTLKVIDDKAIIKGILRTVILYKSEDSLEYVQTDISFAHVLECEGIREDMESEHHIRVYDITANVTPDADGNMCNFDISCELFFRVIARTTIHENCVTDAYLPHGELQLKHSGISVDSVDTLIRRNIDLREKITLPGNLPPIETVYQIIAKPIAESCISEGDKLKVSGYTEVYLLYISEDKNTPACSYKTDVDFSFLCDNPDCMLTPVVNCNLTGISYTINSENSVEIRGNVDVTIECIRTSAAEIVCSAEEAPYTPTDRPSIIVSCVSGGRTLWDIAKEYRVSPEDILSANAFESEAELHSGEALIIPK